MEQLKDNNFLLILLGIGAIILEIALGVATGFDLLLVGIIFIIAGAVGMWLSSFTIALVLITALCLLYVIFGRRFIKNKLSISTQSTNVDALIGKKGKVTKAISEHAVGQVKVDGEIWRAEAGIDIPEGQEVIVRSVSGVTLKVEIS